MCGPRGLRGAKNILYQNLGDGTFADVTTKAHVDQTQGRYAFSVTTLDFDDDGWPDIYVACDSAPSILYHNNRDGTCNDVGVPAGVDYNEDGREQAGMGTTVADYDGDGRPDIFKTNFSDDTPTLYQRDGNGFFSDRTFAAGMGLHSQYLGWGAMFFDFDNDGWPDVILVNGHCYTEVDKSHLGSEYLEPRLLYHNNGNGTFTDVSAAGGPGITTVSSARGLAVGDLRNDGNLSIVISNMNAAPSLLVNDMRSGNHWVAFKTVGARSNRDGIGAKIIVQAGTGKMIEEGRSGSSDLSQSDFRVHFRLGAISKIKSVQERWPTCNLGPFVNFSVCANHTT